MRMVHNSWSKAKGEQANFFSVEIWKDMRIPKGTAILVDGELKEYSYDKDGEKKSFTYIKAYKVTPIQFLKMDQSQSQPAHQDQSSNYPAPQGNVEVVQSVFGDPPPPMSEDDIPF